MKAIKKITSGFRVVVPLAWRLEHDLEEGDWVELEFIRKRPDLTAKELAKKAK